MKRVVLLAIAQCFAMGALTAPAVVGLSLRVREFSEPDEAAGMLGAMISIGSITAMIANPLFGWLADHTGRRRGTLTLGAVAGLVATVGVAWAPTPVALAAAWVAAQAAYNMCFGAINGLISHGLAETDRTRAAGVLSSVSILGTLPGLVAAALLPDDVAAMILAVRRRPPWRSRSSRCGCRAARMRTAGVDSVTLATRCGPSRRAHSSPCSRSAS